MNGARTTYMRRGYLLTALAAAVLLAASPGTAAAQNTSGVTITGPSNNTVNEGGTATYTVTVRGYVDAAVDADSPADGIQADEAVAANSLTVTLAPPDPDSANGAVEGEPADLNSNAHVLSVTFNTPRNASTNPLLFTQSKTISVATLPDNDAENEAFTLAFSLSTGAGGLDTTADGDVEVALATAGTAANPNALIINDTDPQGYKLTLSTDNPNPKEATAFTVNLTASPPHEDGSGELRVNIDKQSGWTLDLDPNPTTVGSGADGTKAISITQAPAATHPNGDGNRVTDTVTVSAHTGVAGDSEEKASLSIDVADIHALQAVTAKVVDADGVVLATQPESVEEGKSVKIAVMPVDKDGKVTTANEDLKIVLASSGDADARDFQVSAPITIDAGRNKSNLVDLTAVGPDEDVSMEMLVLDATVSGVAAKGTETKPVAGVLSIGIVDATEKKIWPKSQDDAYPSITGPRDEAAGADGLNPGESFMVDMGALFGLMTGYEATYDARSEGSAVSISERGNVVMIEAEEAGTSTVTVRGVANEAGSTFTPSQAVSNVAEVAFDVTVVDKELVVTLAANPEEIEEGGTSTITAMANRAVVAGDGDVEIGLEVVGDATLEPGSITIAMGEMRGSAMLTATEDDDYEDETVTVVAAGKGIDGQLSVSVNVMDNDEAPEPTNEIEAKPQDEAYPIIEAAIADGAGDEGLNPGEHALIFVDRLFTVMDGYTATYGVDVVEGDAVIAAVVGTTTGQKIVSLSASKPGEAKVQISGSAAKATTFEAGQPATNIATITFPVTVVDKALTIELHAPDNVMEGNVVEGQSYRLTVMANRVVREDTMVSFGRDRSMSDADEGTDYELNDVTMLAGSDSVTAMLEVLEDMEPDAGTDDNMGEALVIYAMAGDAQSNDLMLTIWDEAVPALPLIGQLVLALFLALGGARLYRRRQG